jgi:hypothetical protein
MSETRFSSREARRTTHLPAPVRERLPTRCASVGGAPPRSAGAKHETHLRSSSRYLRAVCVSRGVTNESASSAPLRERNSNQNG